MVTINNKKILNLRGTLSYCGLEHNIEQIGKLIREVKPDIAYYDDKTEPSIHFMDKYPLLYIGKIDKNNDVERDLTNIKIHPEYIELEKILIEVNCQLYFIFGTCDSNFFDTVSRTHSIKNLKILNWETSLIHYTNLHLRSRFNKFEPNIETNFEKFLLIYNSKPRYHRCVMMDKLCENGLLDDKTIYSWLTLRKNFTHDFEAFKFKCWEEKITTIDTPVIINRFTEKILENRALISLVGETNYNYLFITEKTFSDILIGQIFICYGHQKQNKKLEEFGFKLYDEIFDYSFDDEIYLFDRLDGLINNLKKLKGNDYSEIYNKVRDKIEYNQRIAKNILLRDKFIPKELLDMLDIKYNENFTTNQFFKKYEVLQNSYTEIPSLKKII